MELWLATEDTAFGDELATTEMDDTFNANVTQLWWKNLIYTAADIALNPDAFPDGWGETAQTAITDRADTWLDAHDTHAYRRAWYAIDHGYYSLMGWGTNMYYPLRALVAAWRLTGDEGYREVALLGLDYHMGANPQGRVHTTGLGDHSTTVALHLPSWADGIDELSPGITLFGPLAGVPWQASQLVYGLSVDARDDPLFSGVELPLMPPPWNNEELTIADVGDTLYEVLPGLRRLLPLESANVPSMEFTVHSTISPAAGVTGCLMGPGWEPDAALLERVPRTDAELQSSLWMLP
jgi:hypothetical protein